MAVSGGHETRPYKAVSQSQRRGEVYPRPLLGWLTTPHSRIVSWLSKAEVMHRFESDSGCGMKRPNADGIHTPASSAHAPASTESGSSLGLMDLGTILQDDFNSRIRGQGSPRYRTLFHDPAAPGDSRL